LIENTQEQRLVLEHVTVARARDVRWVRGACALSKGSFQLLDVQASLECTSELLLCLGVEQLQRPDFAEIRADFVGLIRAAIAWWSV
jgi:hypothetical protein